MVEVPALINNDQEAKMGINVSDLDLFQLKKVLFLFIYLKNFYLCQGHQQRGARPPQELASLLEGQAALPGAGPSWTGRAQSEEVKQEKPEGDQGEGGAGDEGEVGSPQPQQGLEKCLIPGKGCGIKV